MRKSIIDELEGLYELEVAKGDFLPEELAIKLADITGRINREIAVYINRKGGIEDISIGDNATVSLPEVEGRRGKSRLTGIRCIHTHPNGDGMLSEVDISSLLKLRLDAMAAIGVKDGRIVQVYAAIPVKADEGNFCNADIYGPFRPGSPEMNSLFNLIEDIDRSHKEVLFANETEKERAILVGLESASGRILNGKSEGERSIGELEELALTAGVTVVHTVLQKKASKDPAYYIGKGMVENLCLLRQAINADLIIFDDELSGAQVRNIENATGAKVIDRTVLILDIFAQRARSKEGKLQVELAQLKYRLPRLTGLGQQLSRLGGGIGTRGPGEKKLEVDKRHIRRRISYLEHELKNLSTRRGLAREGRKKADVPVIALVGYTNVGKSTLMNRLCSSDVFAENKLFATLDPTTRSFTLPDGRTALLVDTVGFIRKLPHELVEAFKSTLEEAVFADVLMHVADASSEEAEEQIKVVDELLSSLGAMDKPIVMVLNKIDLIPEDSALIPVIKSDISVFEVSAAGGQGLDKLLHGLAAIVPKEEMEAVLFAPYSDGWVLPYIHENGKVISEDYTEDGVRIKAIIKKPKVEKLRKYLAEK
ncbi:MAG: GTPase HflX [Clostridia bacterium]|nr:GTPase HflX [Clostridia bacterium]